MRHPSAKNTFPEPGSHVLVGGNEEYRIEKDRYKNSCFNLDAPNCGMKRLGAFIPYLLGLTKVT
jgi:hypothetical protein